MTILSFANILNIKINGEVLKLAGISVIVGIIGYFTTRKTNESITSGLDIKKCFSSLKDVKVLNSREFILAIREKLEAM